MINQVLLTILCKRLMILFAKQDLRHEVLANLSKQIYTSM